MYEIEDEKDLHFAMSNEARVVVIDIYSTTCGPCRVLAPHLERLSASHPNALICKLNVSTGLKQVDVVPTIEFWVRDHSGSRKLFDTIIGADIPKIKTTLDRALQYDPEPVMPVKKKPATSGHSYATLQKYH